MTAMNPTTFCRFVWGVYHLFLGTWFGAMVMLIIAAAITFKTVAAYRPTLGAEPYARLTEIDAGAKYPIGVRVLAGGIVGNVLKGLRGISLVCAAAVAVCLVLQWTLWPVRGWANLVRTVLIAAATAVVLIDMAVISPRVWRERAVMYDPDQSAADRAAAQSRFERMHKLNERIVGVAALSLGAALVLSAWAWPGTPGED